MFTLLLNKRFPVIPVFQPTPFYSFRPCFLNVVFVCPLYFLVTRFMMQRDKCLQLFLLEMFFVLWNCSHITIADQCEVTKIFSHLLYIHVIFSM